MKTYLAGAQETRQWGLHLAEQLQAGDVLALCGQLGAGKTLLTSALLEGLGYTGQVSSPTFSLLQEYVGGRLPVFHLDFYRMQSAAEALNLGWDELLEEPGVLVVEWADQFPDLIPEGGRWILLEHAEQGGRWISETSRLGGDPNE
jgi:tRNA threonylcarbamoyladenosine biosynthesis protein TsaE